MTPAQHRPQPARGAARPTPARRGLNRTRVTQQGRHQGGIRAQNTTIATAATRRGKHGATPAQIVGSTHRLPTREAFLRMLCHTDTNTAYRNADMAHLELTRLRKAVSKAQWQTPSPEPEPGSPNHLDDPAPTSPAPTGPPSHALQTAGQLRGKPLVGASVGSASRWPSRGQAVLVRRGRCCGHDALACASRPTRRAATLLFAASTGTSNTGRSRERPGDGVSPGAWPVRRSPPERQLHNQSGGLRGPQEGWYRGTPGSRPFVEGHRRRSSHDAHADRRD